MVAAEGTCCCLACAVDFPAIGCCFIPHMIHDIICLPCCLLGLGCMSLSKQKYKSRVVAEDDEYDPCVLPFHLNNNSLIDDIDGDLRLSLMTSEDIHELGLNDFNDHSIEHMSRKIKTNDVLGRNVSRNFP